MVRGANGPGWVRSTSPCIAGTSALCSGRSPGAPRNGANASWAQLLLAIALVDAGELADARAEIAALGARPLTWATTPAELVNVLPKQLVAMKALETAAKKLQAPTNEMAAKTDFDRFYAAYVDGQVYALGVVKRKDYDGYFRVVESALNRQQAAERAAVEIGAVECARHPFEDS